MSASVQHMLSGLFVLTAIFALLALAGDGQAHNSAGPAAYSEASSTAAAATDEPKAAAPGEQADAEDAAEARPSQRSRRQGARSQLTMPYFSFSRALPRTAEL